MDYTTRHDDDTYCVTIMLDDCELSCGQASSPADAINDAIKSLPAIYASVLPDVICASPTDSLALIPFFTIVYAVEHTDEAGTWRVELSRESDYITAEDYT